MIEYILNRLKQLTATIHFEINGKYIIYIVSQQISDNQDGR